jgi:hypothetical protein
MSFPDIQWYITFHCSSFTFPVKLAELYVAKFILKISKINLRAAFLQIHAHFHENFEICLKVKYCEVNKERNLHIANGTYNPCKLPKRGQNIHK